MQLRYEIKLDVFLKESSSLIAIRVVNPFRISVCILVSRFNMIN